MKQSSDQEHSHHQLGRSSRHVLDGTGVPVLYGHQELRQDNPRQPWVLSLHLPGVVRTARTDPAQRNHQADPGALPALPVPLPEKGWRPATFRSQYNRLVAIRAWFKWLSKGNHTLTHPAKARRTKTVAWEKEILTVEGLMDVLSAEDSE